MLCRTLSHLSLLPMWGTCKSMGAVQVLPVSGWPQWTPAQDLKVRSARHWLGLCLPALWVQPLLQLFPRRASVFTHMVGFLGLSSSLVSLDDSRSSFKSALAPRQ